MAIVQNTLIGKASGSVGGTTFTSWKGKNVLKSKPAQVANPRTPAQTAQRTKFIGAVASYRQMAPVVQQGFAGLAVGKSAYNAYASENIKNGSLSSNIVNMFDDLTKLKVAMGSLTKTVPKSITFDSTDRILELTFPTTITGNQSAGDILNVVVVNLVGSIIDAHANVGIRSMGTFSVQLPQAVAGDPDAKVFFFFYSPSLRVAEDSQVVNMPE